MRRLFAIIIAALLLASCTKSNNEPKANYLVFGYEGAVCAYCNSYHPSNMAFLMKHTNVYQLKDSLRGPNPVGDFANDADFSTAPMDNGSYLIANTLVDSFPDFLLNSPDSTYGLPGSYPGCLILAVKNNGAVRQWRINWDTTMIPVQIRPYIAQVLSTIDTLYPPFRATAHP